jgi:hypothetical protein
LGILFLGIGLLLLAALLAGARAFVTADPVVMSRFLRSFLMSLAIIGGVVILILSLVSHRISTAVLDGGALALLALRFFTLWRRRGAAGPDAGSFGGSQRRSNTRDQQRSSSAMTREEACAILGLAPGADAAAIKEAHRQLMSKLHPDRGGSTYLAAKLNAARDLLLKH